MHVAPYSALLRCAMQIDNAAKMGEDLTKEAASLGGDLQKQGMDAIGQAQSAGMGAINQARETGQGLVQQGQQNLSELDWFILSYGVSMTPTSCKVNN